MNDVERGRTLRRLRQATGLSQREVGEHFDIDKNSVSLWELGKSRPTVDKLSALDRLYNADGAVLGLWGSNGEPATPTIADVLARLDVLEAWMAEAKAELLSAVQGAIATTDARLAAATKTATSNARLLGVLAPIVEELRDELRVRRLDPPAPAGGRRRTASRPESRSGGGRTSPREASRR